MLIFVHSILRVCFRCCSISSKVYFWHVESPCWSSWYKEKPRASNLNCTNPFRSVGVYFQSVPSPLFSCQQRCFFVFFSGNPHGILICSHHGRRAIVNTFASLVCMRCCCYAALSMDVRCWWVNIFCCYCSCCFRVLMVLWMRLVWALLIWLSFENNGANTAPLLCNWTVASNDHSTSEAHVIHSLRACRWHSTQ